MNILHFEFVHFQYYTTQFIHIEDVIFCFWNIFQQSKMDFSFSRIDELVFFTYILFYKIKFLNIAQSYRDSKTMRVYDFGS